MKQKNVEQTLGSKKKKKKKSETNKVCLMSIKN